MIEAHHSFFIIMKFSSYCLTVHNFIITSSSISIVFYVAWREYNNFPRANSSKNTITISYSRKIFQTYFLYEVCIMEHHIQLLDWLRFLGMLFLGRTKYVLIIMQMNANIVYGRAEWKDAYDTSIMLLSSDKKKKSSFRRYFTCKLALEYT